MCFRSRIAHLLERFCPLNFFLGYEIYHVAIGLPLCLICVFSYNIMQGGPGLASESLKRCLVWRIINHWNIS